MCQRSRWGFSELTQFIFPMNLFDMFCSSLWVLLINTCTYFFILSKCIKFVIHSAQQSTSMVRALRRTSVLSLILLLDTLLCFQSLNLLFYSFGAIWQLLKSAEESTGISFFMIYIQNDLNCCNSLCTDVYLLIYMYSQLWPGVLLQHIRLHGCPL